VFTVYTKHKLDKTALASKSIIAADLDGTLAEGGKLIDAEMKGLIVKLLKHKKFVVISGNGWDRLQEHLINLLSSRAELSNLYVFPTNAAMMYKYSGNGWKKIYSEDLSLKEKQKIIATFEKAAKESGFVQPKRVYGEQVEDRGAQITFLALGRKAPLRARKDWDPGMTKRVKLRSYVGKHLPEFDVMISGLTAIDVVRKGMDKAYGIKRMIKELKCTTDDVLYVGDMMYKGGNDYPVIKTGVYCIPVKSVEETKQILRCCTPDS
jgi:HAD superfamily hydrolase (TIGR01484 family)